MVKQYDIEGDLKNVKTEVEKLNNLLFVVVLIMLIMVAQMLMESWNTKGASYQNFANQIVYKPFLGFNYRENL